jgi:hypothetical protein
MCRIPASGTNVPASRVSVLIRGTCRISRCSHFTLFNSVGNVRKVQGFWRRKFIRDRKTDRKVHGEASHLLAKAGLLENIDLLTNNRATVDVVILKRDVADTVWSFYNRFDFVNNGLAWAFYLDSAYPNVIVNSEPFVGHGAAGRALWYVVEMRVRAAYYCQLMSDIPGLRFHETDLPSIANSRGAGELLEAMDLSPDTAPVCPRPRNESGDPFFGEDERRKLDKLCARFAFDEEELAATYIRLGKRLSNGAS